MLRLQRRVWIPFVATCCAYVACGGSTTNGNGGPLADAGSGLDGQVADGGAAGGCPSSVPTANASCSRGGLGCEYGTDPRRTCHIFADCESGKWSVKETKCAALPEVNCPSSRASASNSGCPTEGAICVYEDNLACTCTTCPNPYPICKTLPKPIWACAGANSDAECPPARPYLGVACTKEGKKCSYGCEPQNNEQCIGGVWQQDPNPAFGCAASTRLVKKDIRYVTPAESATLAREVESIRLATYEYTDPALGRGRHLGFILEDHATSFAGDAEHNAVDLYAYTSTLVAAVQDQAKRIDALEREVTALRSRRK
jgi:hypothetical protein